MNSQITEILRGYARATAFIEQERRARLASMTSEESKAIFNELVAGWEAVAAREQGLERLDSWRLETILAVRAAFTKLAKANGLL
jgi:hypothetical protein